MRAFRYLLNLLFPLSDTARRVENTTEESLGALLHPLLANGATALLPYRHPSVAAAVIEAKFKNNHSAHELLASVLRAYREAEAEEYAELDSTPVVYVPLPLGAKRLRERGYNQVEEILKAARLPYEALLTRTRETLPQTSLSARRRLENVKNAFAVTTPPKPGVRYVVLDDVMTTGATLHAAEKALRQGGARDVRLLALAH